MTLALACLVASAANEASLKPKLSEFAYCSSRSLCAAESADVTKGCASSHRRRLAPLDDRRMLIAADTLLAVAMQGDAVSNEPSPESARPGSEAQLDIKLVWPEAVRFELESAPYEIVVRYDRRLEAEEIAKFTAAAGKLLGDLRWNDASLVIRPAPGYRIGVEASERALQFRFVKEDDAAPETPQAVAQSPAIELELTRAGADAAAGYPGQARKRLAILAKAHPAEQQVQRALADAEAADGATALAAHRYKAMGADDRIARRVIAESDGHATASFAVRDGKTFTQWETGATAMWQTAGALSLGGGIRYVRTAAEGVAGDTGFIAKLRNGETVADLLANVQIGTTVRLSVQASTSVDDFEPGFGGRLILGHAEAQARLVAAYRLPDFSTAEQALFGGFLSRFGGGGTVRITPELVVQADVTRNLYGLADGGVRTRSIFVGAGADYLLLRGPKSLQLSYRLDAEYVGEVLARPNGIPWIPLSDRENHTVQLVYSMPLARTQLTTAAGWTKDRFGGDGPTASIGALTELDDDWRIEASGGVSSISRQAISGRQFYLRLAVTRFLRR